MIICKKSNKFKFIALHKICISLLLIICGCSVYAQELILPKNIIEYKINENKTTEKCDYNSLYTQVRETNETINFFLDEPLSWYSSILNVKTKGSKLLIAISQQVELPEFKSNIRIKEFFINYSMVVNRYEEEKCLILLKPVKDINIEKKVATGKTKFFSRARSENFVIDGFENSIQFYVNEKKLKSNQVIEYDLKEAIKNSKKASQLINLVIKCTSCSGKKSEVQENLDSPINELNFVADFRFIKNQIDNGVFE
jgi:hypothetical protein